MSSNSGMIITDDTKCVFCGSVNMRREYITSGEHPAIAICYDCVKKLADVYEFLDMHHRLSSEQEPLETMQRKIMKPSAVYNLLNDYVIGQDEAKKALAVAVYNHQKRLNDTTGLVRKSNILMIGPSGSGKTLLAQTLAKSMDVPIAIADATSLTEAGYVGDDVENVLVRLIQAADGDIEKAEKGIVFIDEIDKISRKSESRSITRDVSGEGVQHALLKIIEGAEVSVPAGGGRKHPKDGNVMIDTSNILFICGGAFEGLYESETKRNVMGFNSVPDIAEDKEITQELLVKYGIVPELIGRLPVMVKLNELNTNDLIRVMTEPKNAIIKEYQELFNIDGIKLTFTNEAVNMIAELAIEKKTGARGLRSIMENVMSDIMFNAPDDEDITEIMITADTITSKVPIYKREKAC